MTMFHVKQSRARILLRLVVQRERPYNLASAHRLFEAHYVISYRI
jgi:hypothetical protein